MKLNTFGARLVGLLNLEMSVFTETSRALREQSTHFEDSESEGKFGPDILKAKPGPGGGLEVDPFRATFLLLAIIVGGPRKEVATATWRAWHYGRAGLVEGGWVGDEEIDPKPEASPCPLTGEVLFGDALEAILANEDLAYRVERISLGPVLAHITFDGGRISEFERGVTTANRPSFYHVATVEGGAIQLCASLLARDGK